DVGEVRAGGLEVVVVAVDAEVAQLDALLAGEDAERAGDVDLDVLLDRDDAFADLVHQALVRAAHGGDDAELRRAGRRGLARGLPERRDVEPDRPDGRLEAPRLAAEVAVLRAPARLDGDDALDLDLRSAPAHADLVGELQRIVGALVGELQDLQGLRLV